MNNQLKGLLTAVVLQAIGILVVFFIYDANTGIMQFIKRSIADGSFITYGALATIPNIVAFFVSMNRNKLYFGRGIQYFVIAFVLLLAALKFM